MKKKSLSLKIASEIRILNGIGVSRKSLCKRYGISKASLSYIVRNLIYCQDNYTPPKKREPLDIGFIIKYLRDNPAATLMDISLAECSYKKRDKAYCKETVRTACKKYELRCQES